MFRSRTLGALALLALLLICLLVSAPARLLGLVLPPGQAVLQGFQGTLWQGRVSRALVQTPAGYLHLGAVSWQLDPLSLLLFAPRLAVESRWGSQSLAGTVVLRGEGDFDFSGLEASVPADLLRQFVPVRLDGTFALQFEELQLRGALPTVARGRLVWQGGGWNSPSGPVPLGSYAMDIDRTAEGALQGNVITLAGVVTAEGTVELQDRTYLVDLTVQSEGGLDNRLQQALSLLARPVDGGFHIKLDGEF
jgi:general secretion pathway protein N